MRKKVSSILFGLLIIAAGVIYAGNVLFNWDIEIFFNGWWTLFIIIPCLYSMMKHGFHVVNITGFIIGVLLLLERVLPKVIPGGTVGKLIVPIILVGIGVSLLFGAKKHRPMAASMSGNNNNEYTAVFGGQEIKLTHEPISSLKLNAIFGGLEIDLSDVIIEQDIVIEANAIFGGIDIIVPDYVKVKLSSVPIFGGVDCKIPQTGNPDAPTVILNGTAMFGGIDVKRMGQH